MVFFTYYGPFWAIQVVECPFWTYPASQRSIMAYFGPKMGSWPFLNLFHGDLFWTYPASQRSIILNLKHPVGGVFDGF